MPALLISVLGLGGLAYWRRKKIGDDAERFGGAARQAVRGMRSGRKDLLVELGERTYAKSTGSEDPENEAEISRLIGELVQVDAATTRDDELPISEADAAA